MINPNWRDSFKPVIHIDGKPVGTVIVDSISVDTETIKPMGVPIVGYSGSFKLEDGHFADGQKLMEMYMLGSNAGFDVTVRKIKATTRKPRSKKKRIQKKWAKKNTEELTTYRNCSIEGVTTGRFSTSQPNQSNVPKSYSKLREKVQHNMHKLLKDDVAIDKTSGTLYNMRREE
jgi:hypothetical protein